MQEVRFRIALNYALSVKMEHLRRGTYKQLQHGTDIPLSDLNRCGDDLVQVSQELKNEWVTGQYTLPFENEPQEMILHRLNPIVDDLTPEKKHLDRVNKIKGQIIPVPPTQLIEMVRDFEQRIYE